MINFLKKANTVVTIVTTVYAVGKFMYDTFKWYEKKHGKKKRLKKMTQEEFDLAMKRFFRCMKDNGYYWRVKRYILPHGRTKNDLLNDINNKNFNTNFSGLLNYLNLLGPSYNKFERIEPGYWKNYIQPAYIIWRNECSEKYREYLFKI